MIEFTIQIPMAVRNEKRYVQQAYIREFQRVEEQTGDVLTAKHAADILLAGIRNKSGRQQQQIKTLLKLLWMSRFMPAFQKLVRMIVYHLKF